MIANMSAASGLARMLGVVIHLATGGEGAGGGLVAATWHEGQLGNKSQVVSSREEAHR